MSILWYTDIKQPWVADRHQSSWLTAVHLSLFSFLLPPTRRTAGLRQKSAFCTWRTTVHFAELLCHDLYCCILFPGYGFPNNTETCFIVWSKWAYIIIKYKWGAALLCKSLLYWLCWWYSCSEWEFELATTRGPFQPTFLWFYCFLFVPLCSRERTGKLEILFSGTEWEF